MPRYLMKFEVMNRDFFFFFLFFLAIFVDLILVGLFRLGYVDYEFPFGDICLSV